jgi:hypothetical protein
MISRHQHPNLRTSLDLNDRAVFNNWAKRVTAFYALVTISLAAAMMLGADTAADRKLLASTSAIKKVSPAMPVPAARSDGK